MPDLADGARALSKLRFELEKIEPLRQTTAKRVLEQSRRNARSKPTPQARMVASGMQARNGTVIGFGSRRVFGSGSGGAVKLGHLAYGSEFGSNTHRQFGPRNESGYWLHPAADQNPDIDTAHEDHADEAIGAAIRSAGP
jgi:hypothetical protein